MAIGLIPVLDQQAKQGQSGGGNAAPWLPLPPPSPPQTPLAAAAQAISARARPAMALNMVRTSIAATPPLFLNALRPKQAVSSSVPVLAKPRNPLANIVSGGFGAPAGASPPNDTLVSAPGFANDMIPPGPAPGTSEPPGINPTTGSAHRFGLVPSGSQFRASTDPDASAFSLHLPTWLVVSGVVVAAGLGAFALHRALPGKGK